jgi:glycosyltransferase involved in cell wall biosynthesis
MASGLPVVTTDAGGIPYIVTHEETCLMVGRDDPEAMADAALRLLEEEGLATGLARRAREESRKFTWQSARGEWVGLYQGLVRGKLAGRVHAEDRSARRGEAKLEVER